MWGAIIGAAAGGLINGITTGIQNSQLANAYKNAAKQVRQAAEKYSGTAADNAMRQAGVNEAQLTNKQNMEAASANMQPTGKGIPAAAQAQNAIRNTYNANNLGSGYNAGAQRKAGELNAAYNKETADAQSLLNQANVNYNVGQQALQEGWNTLGNGMQMVNNISDERAKEGINNESDLPEADLADAVGKIEAVTYKYIDPSMDGADSGYHVGTTAQSLEKEPAFADCVETGEDGFKKVNINKLIERLKPTMNGLGIDTSDIDEEQYSDVELDETDRWMLVESILAALAIIRRQQENDDIKGISGVLHLQNNK